MGDEGQEEPGAVGAAGALVVGPEFGGDEFGGVTEVGGQVGEEEFGEVLEGDAVVAAHVCVEAVGEVQEAGEGRGAVVPEEREGAPEVAAVAQEVPVAAEAAHALHCGEIQ